MLNSVEHELQILISIKISRYSAFFKAQISLECYFPLINDKMPTFVGILTFMSRKNFMLSGFEHNLWARSCREKLSPEGVNAFLKKLTPTSQ